MRGFLTQSRTPGPDLIGHDRVYPAAGSDRHGGRVNVGIKLADRWAPTARTSGLLMRQHRSNQATCLHSQRGRSGARQPDRPQLPRRYRPLRHGERSLARLTCSAWSNPPKAYGLRTSRSPSACGAATPRRRTRSERAAGSHGHAEDRRQRFLTRRVAADSLRSISSMARSIRPHICAVGLCLLAVLGNCLASPAGRDSAVPLPAAGELLASRAVVRAAPSPDVWVRAHSTNQFRPDSQFQIVLAVKARRGADGGWWYRRACRAGERAAGVGSRRSCRPSACPEPDRCPRSPAHDRGAANSGRGKLLLRDVVAVGRPGAETRSAATSMCRPRFAPGDPFFGPFAS